MSQIITYRHDREYGYCHIKLDSGERILLSEASDYIKIFKLLFGIIPIKTIWKWHRTNDPKETVLKIMDNHQDTSFFDSFVKEIQKYRSTDEIKNKFGK
ncbi:MAG: hypothetical protein Q7K40_04320 [bacterium]|nr:hypothetical protein [bacterium]